MKPAIGLSLLLPLTILALPPQDTHKVLRIVDGDTLVISLDNKPTTIRLVGVDTPESKDPRRPVQHYAKEATRFLTNLLKGESVYIEYDQTKLDKYGRTLGYLYRAPDKLFVNAEIVRQGYGHAYTKYPFRYMKQFRELERKAREAGRGLWANAKGIVYITQSGKSYHNEDCRFLRKSKIAIKLETAIKRGYKACRVCGGK